MTDLERALDALELDVWRAASEIAAEVGAVEAFAAGLRRAPAGRAVGERLNLTSHVTPEIALREAAAPPLSAGIDWLLRSRGTSSKARLVVHKLFPPPAFMRDWSSLARRGRAGLAVAYVWRVVWVAWRVVPALGAVIRARTRADRSLRVGSSSETSRMPVLTKVALATRIWIAFVRTLLIERRLPLPEATRRLAGTGRARTRVDPRRMGRIVGRVLRVGPWQPRCLFSALVLYRLLREQGDPAELVIGLQPQPRSKDAHAWVEVGGLDVGPPPGGRGRLPLARYP